MTRNAILAEVESLMKIARPTKDGGYGSSVTTPRAAAMLQLLGGGFMSGGVALTRDEWAAVRRLYGFRPERPNSRPPTPIAPVRESFATAWDYARAEDEHKAAERAWEAWQDPQPLMQAGADRNAVRYAEADGLRILAWLAKYVPPGEDPLKHLIQLAVDAGWDVDPSDCAWADEEAEAAP